MITDRVAEWQGVASSGVAGTGHLLPATRHISRYNEQMQQANHEPFIRQCYDLARQALANGDHPVGALLV